MMWSKSHRRSDIFLADPILALTADEILHWLIANVENSTKRKKGRKATLLRVFTRTVFALLQAASECDGDMFPLTQWRFRLR